MAGFDTHEFYLALAEAFGSVAAREMRLGGQHMTRIVQSYQDTAKNGNALAKVNQGLANQMRVATVDAYKANVLQERVAPTYRGGDESRYAGGKLLRALSDPSMAEGDAYGIGFINRPLLDRAAAQWYRLNSGASPGIGFSGETATPPGRLRIQFGSNQGFNLHPYGLQEGSGFNVPQSGRGYFNSKGQFLLGKPPKGFKGKVMLSHPSKGIRPRRYLDAGLVSLQQNFAPAYKEFFANALRESISKEKRNGKTNFGPA